MAIPTGTTSRQLGGLVRWMYVGVVVLGMLSWWWPSYRGWGALIGGLLVAMLLWLCWQTVTVNRRVPGHPVYAVLLVPAGVLTYHMAYTGLAAPDGAAVADSRGALNLSMIFQLAMLALAVMLSQSLLPKAVGHVGVMSVCGGAMMGGAIAPMLWGGAEAAGPALGLLGFAGVAVWLSPLWQAEAPPEARELRAPARRELRIVCVAVAVPGVVLLARACPGPALVAAGCAVATLLLAGLVFPGRRRRLLAAGLVLTAAAAAAAALLRDRQWMEQWMPRSPWYGRGEGAFDTISARDNGLRVLAETVGLPATGFVVLGLIACLVVFLARVRRDRPGDRARVMAWCVASALSVCSLLAPGGLFIPGVTLAVGFTWGLMPGVAGRSPKPRPGVIVMAVIVAVMMLLGLARSEGLVLWATSSFWPGPSADKLLHGCVGTVLAMVMAWLMGSRSLWWGLLGIALAAAAGGLGEFLQHIAGTGRSAEYTDWAAHAVGSALAVVPYVLCVGARLCESAEALSSQELASREDRYLM